MKVVEFLKDLVLRASKLITLDMEISAKDSRGDLVTNFDYAIEKFIIEELKVNYPTYDIISEEFNTNNQLTENCFTVDPIDGTINFAHKLPLWTIQVACIENGKTCAAVIYAPKLNEFYWADESGCYLNGEKIKVNNYPISTNLYSIEARNRLPSMMRMEKYSRHSRVTYCGSLNYAWVASGVFGGMVFRSNTLWDYIPGQYLVQQAGGYVYNEEGCHVGANTKEFGEILRKQAHYFDGDEASYIKFDE